LRTYEFFRGGKKMKKIIIILFFFIVSISVFAQDTSLFIRNFSLTKYSKANNHSLFNPDNLIYVQRKNISSEEKSDSLAEGYLRRFAESSKKSRKNRSAVGFIGGGICLGIGAAVLSSAEEKGGFWRAFTGAMLIGAGALSVIGGTLSLVIPSDAEGELKDVLKISDPAQRERASHEALSSLAARAKKWRIITSAVSVASAVYFIVRDKENFYPAAAFGGLAAYDLLTKTLAERTYQNYLKEKEYRNELELRIGIMPYGGVKIDLAFSF
jgi:hypothetical protein